MNRRPGKSWLQAHMRHTRRFWIVCWSVFRKWADRMRSSGELGVADSASPMDRPAVRVRDLEEQLASHRERALVCVGRPLSTPPDGPQPLAAVG